MSIIDYPQIIDILHKSDTLEYAYDGHKWKPLDKPIDILLRSHLNPPDEVKLEEGKQVLFTFINLSRKMNLKPTYLRVRQAS